MIRLKRGGFQNEEEVMNFIASKLNALVLEERKEAASLADRFDAKQIAAMIRGRGGSV